MVWLTFAGFGFGQVQPEPTPYYALPTALVTETDPLSFSYRGRGYGYDAGLGWFGLESNLSAPRLDGTNLYVGGDVLTALGVTPPRLARVRPSGGGTVRVVFDSVNRASIFEAVDQAVGERARKLIVASVDFKDLLVLRASTTAQLAIHGVLVQHVEERAEPRDRCVAEVHHVQRRFGHALRAKVLIACHTVVLPK